MSEIRKSCIVDCRISDKCREFLKKTGYNIIEIPQCESLDEPICAHPDMSIVRICDKWFISDYVYNLFTFLTNREVVQIKKTKKGERLKYPDDVLLNCAVVGDKLICCEKTVFNGIIKYAKEKGLTIVNVSQGYTKCSVCVANDNAIITEDAGIAKICKGYGIDVLLLKNHEIKLNGYDYGFIGGCSGKLSDKILIFAGNIEAHSEYDRIKHFCDGYGVTPISMSDEELYDVGSILVL